MERWIERKGDMGQSPEIDAFLAAVEAVCRQHHMCILHEDSHGAFIVDRLTEDGLEWLRSAHDYRHEAYAQNAAPSPLEDEPGAA